MPLRVELAVLLGALAAGCAASGTREVEREVTSNADLTGEPMIDVCADEIASLRDALGNDPVRIGLAGQYRPLIEHYGTNRDWPYDYRYRLSSCSSAEPGEDGAYQISTDECPDVAGFETDLLAKMLDSFSVPYELHAGQWGNGPVMVNAPGDAFDHLNAGQIDVLAASAAITDAREALYDMSASIGTLAHDHLFVYATDTAFGASARGIFDDIQEARDIRRTERCSGHEGWLRCLVAVTGTGPVRIAVSPNTLNDAYVKSQIALLGDEASSLVEPFYPQVGDTIDAVQRGDAHLALESNARVFPRYVSDCALRLSPSMAVLDQTGHDTVMNDLVGGGFFFREGTREATGTITQRLQAATDCYLATLTELREGEPMPAYQALNDRANTHGEAGRMYPSTYWVEHQARLAPTTPERQCADNHDQIGQQ